MGILLIVIVKKSILGCFGEIRETAAGVGIMGLMVISSFLPLLSQLNPQSQGNKGGTALRLTLTPTPTSLPTTLTFVNAHLAAFDEFAERRNSDYAELGRKLTFQAEFEGLGSDIAETGLESIWESDLLIWMVSGLI